MASPQPPEGFGPWIELGPEPLESLPHAPGVLQVKVEGSLLDYPRGRSAMVLYAGVGDLAGWLSGSAASIQAAAASRGLPGSLRFRFRRDPRPEVAVAELLGRFVARFGSLPALMDR